MGDLAEVCSGIGSAESRDGISERLILNLLSNRTLIFAWVFLLAFAFLFFARSMDRGLPLMGAVVLAFAYALLCTMITGFAVWMRAQQDPRGENTPTGRESFRWAAWVGVGVGTVAVVYLVVDVVTSLTT